MLTISKAILTAFIAKVSKKGSKGRKEKQPVGSPTFVFASSEVWELKKKILTVFCVGLGNQASALRQYARFPSVWNHMTRLHSPPW